MYLVKCLWIILIWTLVIFSLCVKGEHGPRISLTSEWSFVSLCPGLVTVQELSSGSFTVRQEVQDGCMQRERVEMGKAGTMRCWGVVWGTSLGSRRPPETPWSSPQGRLSHQCCRMSTEVPHMPWGPVCVAALKTTLNYWWRMGGWKSSEDLLWGAAGTHVPWSGEVMTSWTEAGYWTSSSPMSRWLLPLSPDREMRLLGWRRARRWSPGVLEVWWCPQKETPPHPPVPS